MVKKIRIRICIVVIIIWLMWFSDWSFAADGDGINILWFSLNYVVSILGRIWVFFAKLAGTFLTNKWVYGEVLWFDALLRRYWNVMKNIANFWLWFYFVYVIFKWLINQTKEDITKKIKDVILWLLVAWVWIQASWFLTAAVIDVSTITLAAAGAFPSQVISENPYVEWAIKSSLSAYLGPSRDYVETGTQLTLFSQDGSESSFLESENVKLVHHQTFTGLVDALMPNADDVSGPLYYFWYTVLKTNVVTNINSSGENWIKSTIINTIIQWWTTIVFAIEMIILCVVALMRIIYLWMFIILSPLAVLLWCIEKSWQKIWDGGNDKSVLSKFMKQIKFKSFLLNVFKPTLIVLWFWVAVLFVSLMNKVLVNDNESFDLKWTKITSVADWPPASGNPWDQTYTTVMDNNFLNFTLTNAWKTFLEFILSVITVMIVYLIISFVVKMWDWNDFVSKKISWLQKWLWNLISSAPIIPVPWYDKNGQKKVSGLSLSGLNRLPEAVIGNEISEYQKKTSEQTDDVMKMLGYGDDNHLTETEKTEIINAWTLKTTNWLDILKDKWDYIRTIRVSGWKWLKLDPNADRFWQNQFSGWLSYMIEGDRIQSIQKEQDAQIWINMINRWKAAGESERTLENMFKNNHSRIDSLRAYAKFFKLKWAESINSWEELMRKDISSIEDTE